MSCAFPVPIKMRRAGRAARLTDADQQAADGIAATSAG
jgi:hypothetical protein